MLGKRLAAISLLSQGANPHQVGKILQLSPTTAVKIHSKLGSGKFSNAEKVCIALRKGPLQHYLEQLFTPLPKYGTGITSVLLKER